MCLRSLVKQARCWSLEGGVEGGEPEKGSSKAEREVYARIGSFGRVEGIKELRSYLAGLTEN